MNISDDTLRLFAATLTVLLYVILCIGTYCRIGQQQRCPQEASPIQPLTTDSEPPILIAFASQTGTAEGLAQQTGQLLHRGNRASQVLSLGQVTVERLLATKQAFFIVSTYGEGDSPDNAATFVRRLLSGNLPLPQLAHLHYGLLALGDKHYTQFCEFGLQLDTWLTTQQATALFPHVRANNVEPEAIRQWQHQVELFAGISDLAQWEDGNYQGCTLSARRQLNPGSVGKPIFHLEISSPISAKNQPVHWESGDLVRIQAPADPEYPREYTIASLPNDGRLHLLVRQEVHDDGSLGIASGWLTEQVAIGEKIQLQIRAHSNFRLGDNHERPLILIGNGTGLAGLRSHIKARALSRITAPCWLLFGERNAACDSLYGDELNHWLQCGVLERLDRVFSRDNEANRYVQDKLHSHANTIRDWIDRDAAIYVCGSRQGMAQGVDKALTAIVGETRMQWLIENGRYRRDVY